MNEQREYEIFSSLLFKEADLWEKEGLISQEQRYSILGRYKKYREIEERGGPSRMITTITILGSVLIGVGVMLFIASNWSAIPRMIKVAMIFTVLIGTYAVGYYLRHGKGSYPRVGASLIFLGSILFGGAIFLIAQIFHISAHYPNGVLLWGLGILPLAYLEGFTSILTLSLLVLCFWFESEMYYNQEMFRRGSILGPVMLDMLAGIALWMTGLFHRARQSLVRLSNPYLVLGMVITLATAFVFTFELPWNLDPRILTLWPFIYGCLAAGIMAAAAYVLSQGKERFWLPELLVLLCFLAVALYSVHFGMIAFRNPDSTFHVMVLMNCIYIAIIVGLIILGYLRSSPVYINTGLFFFVVFVCARYFDILWKYLPRSIFFILGGAVLLAGGAALERKRRKIIAEITRREVRS